MADIGHVTIAGAGPGDPGLITVAAAKALAEADVVVFDALANRALLRNSRAGALLIDAGKRAGDHTLTQREIEAVLLLHARAGMRVLRLKGGDPFVFGRGGEEALACARAGVPFTIIPGITSAIAAPAYAGIPLTHRGVARNFVVITGEGRDKDAPERWNVAAAADTVVILMGAATLEANVFALIAAGKERSTPVACIQWGTHAKQRVVTGDLETIARVAQATRLGSPMVVVVGEVVRLAEEIGWHAIGPLAGRSIVVTRARDQASGLVALLEGLGADVVEAPVIRTTQLDPNPELAGAIETLPPGGWIVLASARGVEALFATVKSRVRDARSLAPFRIAAIGEATTEALARFGLRADFVPSRASGDALGAQLPLDGAPVLIVGSNRSRDELADGLRLRGADVRTVIGYLTQEGTLDGETLEQVLSADAITFTSSSTVANLQGALAGRALPPETRLLSIGPRTSATLRERFGRVDGVAREATIAALVATTVEALAWE
jgi:uroporphyrinogen III methyltransferase/synthase